MDKPFKFCALFLLVLMGEISPTILLTLAELEGMRSEISVSRCASRGNKNARAFSLIVLIIEQ